MIEQTTTARRKTVIKLSQYLLRYNIITIEEKPYIGQYGPNRKPLLTNFLYLGKVTHTSIAHPIKEYIKNNTKKNKTYPYLPHLTSLSKKELYVNTLKKRSYYYIMNEKKV